MRSLSLVMALLAVSCTTAVYGEQTTSSAVSADTILDRNAFGPAAPLRGAKGAVDGIWLSRGYGWLVAVEGDVPVRYEIGETYCYRLPETARGKTDMLSIPFRFYRRLPDGETITLQYLVDDAGPVFDRLDELPSRCLAETPADAATSLSVMLDLFQTHYAHFERRGVDWPALRETAEDVYSRNPGEKGLYAAADMILAALQDSHTKLLSTVEGEGRRLQYGLGSTLPRIRAQDAEFAWLTGIFAQLQDDILDPGSRHVANDRILWGTIDGRVGYIQVFVMGGFTDLEIDDPDWGEAEIEAVDRIFDEAKTAFADMEAVIIDLSNNRGGYDKVARRLAEHFAPEPTTAYVTSTRGAAVMPHPRQLMPAGNVAFDGPVILMTSDVTVSGGELATLSFRQLPQVVHIGMPTRGSFSTPLSKGLPNGWVIELSNAIFAAPDGTIHEGSGIPPQMALTIYAEDDPVVSHGAAIDHVIDNMSEIVPRQGVLP